MLPLPQSAKPILVSLLTAFSEATARHVLILMIGAILARGRHTVTAILRTVQPLAQAHFSTYHRVLSRAAWSPWRVQRILIRLVLRWVPQDQVVDLIVDETIAEHRGPKVYGKGCHRDGCRSSRRHTAYRWGHKWVVLAIRVKFPFAPQAWALPVMAALCLPEKLCRARKRRYKTPSDLARQMCARLIHAFPGRKFRLLGDGGYASVELAAFCRRRQMPLVSRLRPDAALYAAPRPPKPGHRPTLVGRRLDSPRQAVGRRNAAWRRTTVPWYSGQTRKVWLLTDTGIWYRRGRKPIPLRWVYVVDREGQHQDTCLFCTDPALDPRQIVALFIGRWSIEVTFEEVRAHLGFETTRQWSPRAVLRAAPGLLGMFTVVSLIFAAHARRHKPHPAATAWYPKSDITFSDTLQTVRRELWSQTLLAHWGGKDQCDPLPNPIKKLILNYLSAAA
jgi:hypothetical protein